MSNHVVHRIRFDLRVGSRPQAVRAQDAASRFAAEALPAILDQCLAGLAPDDRVLVFDRIDLQIGAVPEREFAEQLPSRFARALADALFAARHARAIGEPTAAHETPLAERRRQRLFDFLDFGLFAAPADASEPATPAALLDALLESEPDMVGFLAAWWRDRPDLRVRLARQFPDPTLGRLVGAVSEAGARVAAAIMEALTRALGDGPAARSNGAIRAAAWERILGAAMEGRPAPSLADIAGAVQNAAAGSGRDLRAVGSALRAALVRAGAPSPADFEAAAALGRDPGRAPAGQGDRAHGIATARAAREVEALARGAGRSARAPWSEAAAAVAARLRAAGARKEMIDGLVEQGPRRFLPRVLGALVPAFAGFVETVLIAVAAVEDELSPPRADSRRAWRLALMLVLEAGGAPLDLPEFVARMVAGMAAARSLPPRAYLDRLDQRARSQAGTAPRHAPLVEIIAAIRASAPAAPARVEPGPSPAAAAREARRRNHGEAGFPAGREAPGPVPGGTAGSPAAAARDRAAAARQPDRDAEAVARFLRGAALPASPDWLDEAAFLRRVTAMVRSWRDERLWSAWREPAAEPGVRPGFAARLRWLFGAVHRELGAGAGAEAARGRASGDDAPTPAGNRLLRHLRGEAEASDDARRSLRAIAFRTLARPAADFDALLALVAADPDAAPDRLLALFARPPPGAAAAARADRSPGAAEAAAARGGESPGAFDREIAVLAHVVAFDDRPWWDAARAGATIQSALFDPLERDPRATLAALRGAARPRLARALVRYAPIGALRRLVDQLSPGLAEPFIRFVAIASDRARAFGADLAETPWRIGVETLLSDRTEGRFDRFVEAMNARIAREPGLPPGAVESLLRDPPAAERRPQATPSASEAGARAGDEAALFGAPILFDAAPPDALQLLRHLLRYGSLPPGSAGVDALEARLDLAFSTSPTAARRLILEAIGRPLPRRNMTALLSRSALRRIGELVVFGDNGLALEFVSDLFRAGALPEPGSGAVVHEALFRAAARMGRAAQPQPLIREVLADVAAFEGRDADAALRSWRAALARLVPPSAAAVRILRGLEAAPVVARRSPPRPAAPRRTPGEATIPVANAGIVLLGPHFGTLFDRLDLLDGGTFRDAAAQATAIDLLRHLVFGAVETREYELALDKILCGMELGEPLAAGRDLGETDRVTCDGLLRSITQSWTPLRNSSIATLREAFLQREGLLKRDAEQWILKVAAKPYDMLLDSMPWPYKLLKAKWMRSLVRVEWR